MCLNGKVPAIWVGGTILWNLLDYLAVIGTFCCCAVVVLFAMTFLDHYNGGMNTETVSFNASNCALLQDYVSTRTRTRTRTARLPACPPARLPACPPALPVALPAFTFSVPLAHAMIC